MLIPLPLHCSWGKRHGLQPVKFSDGVRSGLLPAEQGTGESRANYGFGSCMRRTLLLSSLLWQVWMGPAELPTGNAGGVTQAGSFQR